MCNLFCKNCVTGLKILLAAAAYYLLKASDAIGKRPAIWNYKDLIVYNDLSYLDRMPSSETLSEAPALSFLNVLRMLNV